MQIIPLPYRQYEPVAVAAGFARHRGCVFLDSAARGKFGRYSFLSANPFMTLVSKGRNVNISTQAGTRQIQGDPWTTVRTLWKRYRLPNVAGLPPLQGGLIGYWGYDLNQHLERLPAPFCDDLEMPDLWLGAYDWVIAWDHVDERCWLISTGVSARTPVLRKLRAERRAQDVLRQLEHVADHGPSHPPASLLLPAPRSRPPLYELQEWSHVQSTFTPQAYMDAVRRAREYIFAGDVYQVNLSQRLEAPLRRHPWEIYAVLRQHNPADFSAFLHCGDTVLASCSPERFLHLHESNVETRPIKGTIARGTNTDTDQRQLELLQTSLKDRAENLMIVDLLRNDLGRVCEIGSVHVPELWAVEQHPTVYHLVSTIRGRLKDGLTPLDLLQACFPGGSITGAPKIRAMEIIAELEPTARGAYCGAIGYVGWNGQMDTNIIIRTLVVRQGRVSWQVGGGIVADSTPEGEYTETLLKARALSEAVLQTW